MNIKLQISAILMLLATSPALPHTPADLLARVGIDQHLAQQVPPDASFLDENGAPVRLANYFGEHPVIIVLAYYNCPNLCTLVINGMIEALRPLELNPGTDFDVVVISIDPRDTPALAKDKKISSLGYFGRPATAAGWHFLTGEQDSISRTTSALGFRYFYDEAQKEYAHAAGIVVLTPQGIIARYFPGVQFAPQDLRTSLANASRQQIGTVTERLLMLCFHYDPRNGQYGPLIQNWLRALAGVTLLVLAGFIGFALRRELGRNGRPAE